MVKRQKGVTLIISVSVMMTLSIMAITFVQLMTYEQAAASNYSAIVDAKLTSFAGIEKAKAILFDQAWRNGSVPEEIKDATIISTQYKYSGSSLTVYQDTNYDIEDNCTTKKDISFTKGKNLHSKYSYSGCVGKLESGKRVGRYDIEGNFFALKVRELQGKLNVNSHIVYPYDKNKQKYANIVLNRLIKALADKYLASKAKEVADAIRPADDSEPTIYTSMTQIETIVADQSPLGDAAGFIDELCVYSWLDKTTRTYNKANVQYNVAYPKSYYDGAHYIEWRAPVNINTASKKLLEVLIANIKATAYLFKVTSTSANDSFIGGNIAVETDLKEELWKVEVDLSSKALAIATKIYDKIHTSSDPFTSWGEFNAFIDSSAITDLLKAIEINKGYNLDEKSTDTSKQEWLKDNPQWLEACKDALKSNFNPNSLSNFVNHNINAYRKVTKRDFYTLNDSLQVSGYTYTTEFCFHSQGRFEITSLGKIVARGGALEVATSKIRTNISLYDIVTHTTEADFATGTFPAGLKSFPDNYESGDTFAWGSTAHKHMGWIELETQGLGVENTKLKEFSLHSKPSLIAKVASAGNVAKMDSDLNLASDGLFSNKIMYRKELTTGYPSTGDPKCKYTYNYFTENTVDKDTDIIGRGALSNNKPTGTKIANYKGALGCWVKPDIAFASKRYCGFFNAAQVIFNTAHATGLFQDENGNNFREGTQIFVFKDTSGNIRIARLYFAGYFDKQGEYFGSKGYQKTDIERKYARRDVVFKIPDGFEAHTWHYVQIAWDDTAASLDASLVLYIDGTKVAKAQYSLGEYGKGQFCIVNEKAVNDKADDETNGSKMDGLFIAGFYRNQLAKDNPLSLFRFGDSLHTTGNCTMSDVRTYDTPDIAASSLSRFQTNKIYTQSFTMPTKGMLGPLRWTCYPNRSGGNEYIKCYTSYHKSAELNSDPGYDGDGLLPKDSSDKLQTKTVKKGDTITYSANFNTARNRTPVLDSVSLVIICPKLLSIEYCNR